MVVDVVDVDVEVDVLVVEVGAEEVDESTGSSAATLQAVSNRATATNLATVVRIETSVRTGPRLTGITRRELRR